MGYTVWFVGGRIVGWFVHARQVVFAHRRRTGGSQVWAFWQEALQSAVLQPAALHIGEAGPGAGASSKLQNVKRKGSLHKLRSVTQYSTVHTLTRGSTTHAATSARRRPQRKLKIRGLNRWRGTTSSDYFVQRGNRSGYSRTRRALRSSMRLVLGLPGAQRGLLQLGVLLHVLHREPGELLGQHDQGDDVVQRHGAGGDDGGLERRLLAVEDQRRDEEEEAADQDGRWL